jgi:S-adenosylmethionine synthetase
VARKLVQEGLCERADVRVSCAIGVAAPFAVGVDTFGTGDPRAAEEFVRGTISGREPSSRDWGCSGPIYGQTTYYGHFGRPGLPWEELTVA